MPSGPGFQVFAAPVASSAARSFRAAPPIVLNCPPAYTSPPPTANASIGPLGLGFQAVATPLASIAASEFRNCPPMIVNWPPTYTVPPLSTMQAMEPFGPGFQLEGMLEAPSNSARPLRGNPPRLVKSPPT